MVLVWSLLNSTGHKTVPTRKSILPKAITLRSHSFVGIQFESAGIPPTILTGIVVVFFRTSIYILG